MKPGVEYKSKLIPNISAKCVKIVPIVHNDNVDPDKYAVMHGTITYAENYEKPIKKENVFVLRETSWSNWHEA